MPSISNSPTRSLKRLCVSTFVPLAVHAFEYASNRSPVSILVSAQLLDSCLFSMHLIAEYRIVCECSGCDFIVSATRSISSLRSAISTCASVTVVSLSRSASSPATRSRSNALRASPCSCAAMAAHLLIALGSTVL